MPIPIAYGKQPPARDSYKQRALNYYGVESVFVRVLMENDGLRMFPSRFGPSRLASGERPASPGVEMYLHAAAFPVFDRQLHCQGAFVRTTFAI